MWYASFYPSELLISNTLPAACCLSKRSLLSSQQSLVVVTKYASSQASFFSSLPSSSSFPWQVINRHELSSNGVKAARKWPRLHPPTDRRGDLSKKPPPPLWCAAVVEICKEALLIPLCISAWLYVKQEGSTRYNAAALQRKQCCFNCEGSRETVFLCARTGYHIFTFHTCEKRQWLSNPRGWFFSYTKLVNPVVNTFVSTEGDGLSGQNS